MAKSAFTIIAGTFAPILLLGILVVQPAKAQTETVIYNFTNTSEHPTSPLVMDSAGNLYGTSSGGGPDPGGYGAVFELVNSSGTFTERVLHYFGGTGDGVNPFSGPLMDSAGNLYGTTNSGGAAGKGTAFELVNSGGTYTEKILHSFGTTSSDGINPSSVLLMDSAGNLYGTTWAGGPTGLGTVFELVNASGTYNEKIIYSFAGPPSDGEYPIALLLDSTGNVYGATNGGGASGDGTVFELVNASGSYTERVLHSFAGPPSDGRNPTGLMMDSDGNFYGTTQLGGASANCPNNCGTVFELVNNSGNYAEKILHSFTGVNDGAYPDASLVMDATGKLYGTTGGDASISLGLGTLFELTNSSGSSAEHALNVFAGPPGDGATPGTPILDSAGNLYGATSDGGLSGYGIAFKFANVSALTVAVTPPSLNFGNRLLGTPGTTQSITVNNIGTAGLTFASGAVTGSGANAADFAITSDGCSGHTLAPATGTCTVAVTYTPSILGSETASLSFADNGFGNPQTVPLSGKGQDFSFNPIGNTSQTVSRGNSVIYDFNVVPNGGFTGTVTLTCAGVPANSLCTVGSPTVGLDGNLPFIDSVYVLTSGSGDAIPRSPSPSAPPFAFWIILAGLAGPCVLARFGAKCAWIRPLASIGLLTGLALVGSCGAVGGSGHPGYHNPPTPTGTYAITIAGTSGGLTHTLTLTLTVQ